MKVQFQSLPNHDAHKVESPVSFALFMSISARRVTTEEPPVAPCTTIRQKPEDRD